MLTQLSSFILIFLFAFFPIFLWGYAINILSDHEWNRARFFYGMAGGGLSVSVIYFLHTYLLSTIWIRIGALIGVLTILLVFVYFATGYGSPYVKVFLRKLALLHAGLFLLFFSILEFTLSYFGEKSIEMMSIIGAISGYLFAASLEESLKHLSSVGLTAKEFRFSRRDLLVFGFFITLGFVFLENILYLWKAYPAGVAVIFSTGITRSIFSLLAHLFAASICVMVWWKALSYGVFSWKYIVTFISGFILATFAHFLFNTLLQGGHMIIVTLYVVIAYVAFTQWLVLDE